MDKYTFILGMNEVRMLNIKALKEQRLKKYYLIMHKKSNIL